jgi:1-acyl-sn-glycerol-3-phosphate acyltransferase
MILIKTLMVWFLVLTLTLILTLIAVPFGYLKKANIIHILATLWGKGIAFIAGIRIKVDHPEKVYRDGPVIVLSNHQSMFDIPVFYSFLEIQFRWMSKASLFKLPLVGRAMHGAGYIPVEREDPRNARASLFSASERVKAGASLIIFPEGTRGHLDGRMLPFKKGAFLLAKMAGVPIQPITVVGASVVMPIQKDKWIQRIYSAHVNVFVHDIITAEEIATLEADELSKKVRSIIESALPETSKNA